MIQILLFMVPVLLMIGLGLFCLGVKRGQLTTLEQWTISIGIGYVIWSLVIYITAWINVRPLGFVLVLGVSLYGWYRHLKSAHTKFSLNVALLLLVVLGSAGQLFLVYNSGLHTDQGMNFYGINYHDGMWHVALMETLRQQFPPTVPTFSGLPLSGYHYMVDLFGSELVSLFGISPFWLTFRLLPGLFSVLTGLTAYAVMKRLKHTELAALLTMFLIYFGGSFSFMLQILGMNLNPGESAFWSQQSITTFINLPLGISFGLITVLLLLLLIWQQTRNNKYIWLSALVVGMMVSVKVYGGLVVCGGFGVFILVELIKQKRIWLIAPLLLAALMTIILVVPHLQSGKSTFLWEPGWFLRTKMEAPDRVNYIRWEQLRQVYSAHGNSLRLIQYWMIAFVVFAVGNAGARVMGLIAIFKRWTSFNVILWSMVLLGVVMPTMFIQAGVVWNTIQFVYYSLFLMSFAVGMAVDLLPKKTAVAACLVVVLLSLPSNWYTLSSYAKKYMADDVELVNNEQIEALNYIRSLPRGTVISPYYETAFVPAFSGQSVYYSDITQSSILLVDPSQRETELRRIFVECRDEPEILEILHQGKVKYVYLDKEASDSCTARYSTFTSWSKLFDNNQVTIYGVN